ncbi:hypothetical protein V3O24_04675 [Methylobacter sp. Wu8]|uniref:hypothetical protein n=1 Tax=Methylobacter sp. Wu8 TaxID=3118457 RepID=UPI002F345498
MKKIGLGKILILGLALAAILQLAGCPAQELDDGYQIGDITHIVIREEDKIKQARDTYCGNVQDSAARAAALRLIRIKYPFIPENGICG